MSLVKACGRGVAGYGRAEQSSWRAPFFFVQAADTQLGMMDYWGSNGKVYNFLIVIKLLNSPPPLPPPCRSLVLFFSVYLCKQQCCGYGSVIRCFFEPGSGIRKAHRFFF
jgi:hypothetical protein